MLLLVIGERSESSVGKWMENFVLPCMPICSIYIYICVPYIHNPESAWKIFGLGLKKRKFSSWEKSRIYSRFVNDDENCCRNEGHSKEILIFTWPVWLISGRERMLEFYSD